VELGRRVSRLRQTHPIFLGDFWNDGPAVGGCMAGGKTYLHILNSGKVEPCVFAHFGVDRIQEKSVLEAANSPFFRAIRREFPYSDNGNLRRPCMIIDNPEVLRKLVEEHLVPAGHEHSEDLIYDPAAPERFLLRCTRQVGSTPAMCLHERRIDGADIMLRFPRAWLSDWRAVAGGIDRLIARLHARGG
jgi:hypothetical protein